MNIKKHIPYSVKQSIRNLIVQTVTSPPVRAFYCAKFRQTVDAIGSGVVKLHFGCGPRHLDGWVNVDLIPNRPQPDILIDVQLKLPLRDACVDYIYSEDLIEHLTYDGAKNFLSECSRVLKPGGMLRVGTPDLESFMRAYLDRSQGDLDFYREHEGCQTFAEMFNCGMRAWGHTFIYDEETLSGILAQRGFQVARKDFNDTEATVFEGLDLRNPVEGAHSFFLECRKLPASATTKQQKSLVAAR